MVRSTRVKRQAEFTDFYLSARDDCLRTVLLTVRDRQLAEDVVAEAFARAWASWRKVSEHPAPASWVVRTALNLHVSWWRRGRHEVAFEGYEVTAPPQGVSGLDDALVKAVQRLPARQREVITLRIFFDLDTDTTAKLLGVAPGTVGTHLHRAICTLREQIPSFTDQEA